MMRIYKFLISEGFVVEYYSEICIELYFKKSKQDKKEGKYKGKKNLRLTIIKEHGSWYRTLWESKKYGDYRIDAKGQGFIFDELKKYGFERDNDV